MLLCCPILLRPLMPALCSRAASTALRGLGERAGVEAATVSITNPAAALPSVWVKGSAYKIEWGFSGA